MNLLRKKKQIFRSLEGKSKGFLGFIFAFRNNMPLLNLFDLLLMIEEIVFGYKSNA